MFNINASRRSIVTPPKTKTHLKTKQQREINICLFYHILRHFYLMSYAWIRLQADKEASSQATKHQLPHYTWRPKHQADIFQTNDFEHGAQKIE
jgi:hypothetical protein